MIGRFGDDVRQGSTALWIGRDRSFTAEPANDMEAVQVLCLSLPQTLLLRAGRQAGRMKPRRRVIAMCAAAALPGLVAWPAAKNLGRLPAELPVQQATRFGLHLNAVTARSLGLTIPTGIRLRATEVIE